MRYSIVYDKPGRLRLRCGMYAFNEQQGFGLAALLRENPAVLSVEVTYRNGGMLIYYQPGSKAAVLERLTLLKNPICQNWKLRKTI